MPSTREWCVVVDLKSFPAARKLGRTLREEGFDVEVDLMPPQVWCFAESEHECRVFRDHVVALAEEGGHDRKFAAEPSVRFWSEDDRRYVDPDAPEDDAEDA
jgi:hypothetical protein